MDSVIEYFPNSYALSPNFGVDHALNGDECSSFVSGQGTDSTAVGYTFAELAWTPVRITHPNGDVVCSILIPDNSELQMIRHIGTAGSGMLFNDVNNGIGFHNYHN